jgi:GT2 family glycosyltransferase
MFPRSQASIVVLVATFRRSGPLERMLKSLAAMNAPLAVVIVDNADDPATRALCEAPLGLLQIARIFPGSNLGCGGGLEYGEREALERYPQATHFWIMDDDTETAPGALECLLAAMEKEKAAVACPSVLDSQGRIAWFPGVLDARAFKVIKKRVPLETYLAELGSLPKSFSWACGVSLLVKREALEQAGLHRADFWVRGEDIEYSLRLTYRSRGIYVPDAVVYHYPPAVDPTKEREKEFYMLRNHTYIALYLPHGHRILRRLPGAVWRYVKNFRSLSMTLEALANGVAGRLGPRGTARAKN